MERVNFNYSLKNIPIPSKNAYLKNMMHNLESFIKRIRWKAFHFENANNTNEGPSINNFGFKTTVTPGPNEHLKAFEYGLYDMVKNIEFKNVNSVFQRTLSNDKRRISDEKAILVPVDKTNNMYKVDPESYNKLLTENITKMYKKTEIYKNI